MPTGRKWTRDELLVALNLYRKLSFGQLHARNPVILELAEKLERSANSLALKLVNLASLDPLIIASGRRREESLIISRKMFESRDLDSYADIGAKGRAVLAHGQCLHTATLPNSVELPWTKSPIRWG